MRQSRKSGLLIASIAAAIVALVVLAGILGLGWWPHGSSSPGNLQPLPHLSITLAARSAAEVDFLLTTARPLIEPGDSFDLVVGNGSLSQETANQDAQQLRSEFSGVTVFAHTSGLENYSEVTEGVGTNVSGVLYDYEPGYEPEFTFNFTQTLANLEEATAIAHRQGVASVGYVTGRPILESSLEKYGWNYAVMALSVDRLIAQTQTYCAQSRSAFLNATSKVIGQFQAANMTSVPTFQITIGNATTQLPNGVTAVPAYDCASELVSIGLHTLYIWWDQGGESDLLAFLQDIGRS